MEESAYTIFEERAELVFSPGGGGGGSDASLKTAHFLRPTSKASNSQLPPRSISAKSETLRDSTALDVSFKGWRLPKPDWRDWVDQMHSKHQSLWKKVGIYEAIMSSKCWIGRNRDVVLGLAEKWCSETNTFMFPWGEATLTLEDVMLLGGYPVLGYPVLGNPFFSCPLSTAEEKKTHEKLVKVLASCGDHKAWLKYFMGSEQELEHQAFLSAWLSKYVFPIHFSSSFLSNHVFPIAIHLARGTPMAFTPAVLSSIYRDLGFIKDKLVSLDEHLTSESLVLYAPFQIVQLWVWERFPVLSPTPKAIASGDPRAARWDKLRSETVVESVRLAVESAGESFQWRPYASAVKNWEFTNCYGDEEQWIMVGPGLDEEFKSLVRCLRTSELVGPGCIQQYLPHRVAQQFGMDQDIPGLVARRNDSPMIANSYYDRPIRDAKLYVPPRICRSGVTLQYSEWWKQLAEDTRPVIKQKPRNPMVPQDAVSGRIATRSSTESSFALVCHNSKVGGALERNNLDSDVQKCSSSGCERQLTSPAGSLACSKMKQVTEKEGIEDMFGSVVTRTRSRRNRKRSRSLALILQEDNRKDDLNVPESDETKEDALAEGENNKDVPSGFARTTTEMKKCDFVVRVEKREQIVRDRDGQINVAGIPNHVAVLIRSPEVANTKSVGQEENALLEKPEAENLFSNGGEGMNSRVKIPGLKLEAMIAELEVKVAALKAARLKNVSVKNAKRTCLSFHSSVK